MGKIVSITVCGDAMIEAGIEDGDAVQVELDADPKDGDVVLADLDGTRILRELRFYVRGYVTVVPKNAKLQPVTRAINDLSLRILGVVR